MKTRILTVAAVCTAIVGAAVTFAADPEGAPQDGRRSRCGQRFEAADSNGDGVISLAEFEVIHARRLERIKEKLGDRFDEDRERPSAENIFAKIDADQNGELSRQELMQFSRKRIHNRRRNRHQNQCPAED